MKKIFVSFYCYLSLPLRHELHPKDENACTFAQSVSLYEGFSSFGWKPTKSSLLLNGTIVGLHELDVSRWNLFRPNKSFCRFLQACECQYLVSSLLQSTMCLVWNEIIEVKIIQMFTDEKCIPALFLSY